MPAKRDVFFIAGSWEKDIIFWLASLFIFGGSFLFRNGFIAFLHKAITNLKIHLNLSKFVCFMTLCHKWPCTQRAEPQSCQFCLWKKPLRPPKRLRGTKCIRCLAPRPIHFSKSFYEKESLFMKRKVFQR